MLAVVATVRAREGRERELEALLRHLVAETRREAGCIQYDLHVSSEDAASFAFYERWESPEALEAHLESPHILGAFGRLEELAESLPAIARYELIL